MTDSTCPRCGAGFTADAAAGLCPACLLEEGFLGSSVDESADTDGGTFPPASHVGPFEIVRVRGRGGMATVYEAYDGRLDRAVALKVLPPGFLHDVTFARRFEQEARVVAKLEHPNIIPIYARGIDEGVPWMSMRLLPGGNVGDVLEQGRPQLPNALRWLCEVANALDYAHAQGVVHRDVKPTNILLDAAGQAYVADFGLAQMLDRASHLTVGGTLVGTPQYMAPEQALGSDAGPAADIYSLGIVAYELLTGRAPFTGETPMAVLMKHVNEPLPSVRQETCAPALVDVVRKATAKKPEERWPSAGAFASALTRAASLPTTQVASAAPSSAPSSVHRRLRMTVPVSAAALLIAAVAWFEAREPRVQPAQQAAPATHVEQLSSQTPQHGSASVAVRPPAPLQAPTAAAVRSSPPPGGAVREAQLVAPPLRSTTEPVLQNAAGPRDVPSPAAPMSDVAVESNTPAVSPARVGRTDIVIPPAELNTAASVADVVIPPVRLTTVAADYPAAARAAELEGDVIVDGTVAVDGRVTAVDVVKSVHPLLDESARRAVLRYAYRPGTRNGSPEAARVRVTVSFRLE